ncbi:MAG: hypothetical protein ACX931_15580 [Saccharospirillum sp.]
MLRQGKTQTTGLVLWCLLTPLALAQPELSGSVNLFGTANHSVRDGDHNGDVGLGAGIDIGASETRGSHSYNLGYGASRTQRYNGDYSDSVRLNGSAGYRFAARNGRLDANASHRVTTSNRSGLIYLDPDDFTTQNQLSAGLGLNQRLGEVTSARLSTQAGATFNEDSSDNGQSASAQLSVNRRLSERTTAGVSASRSVSLTGYDTVVSEIDSAQATYSRVLSNGALNLSAGLSEARTDDSAFTTATGSTARTWVNTERQFVLAYNRSVSSSVVDLSVLQLNAPAEGETDATLTEEDLQITELTLRDQVSAQFSTTRLCELCRYSLSLSSARLENLSTDDITYQYQVTAQFGYQISPLQSASASYSLALVTDTLTDGPWNRRQQITLGWQRQIAETVQATASASHSWLGGEETGRRTDVRLGVSYGF